MLHLNALFVLLSIMTDLFFLLLIYQLPVNLDIVSWSWKAPTLRKKEKKKERKK